MARKRLNLAFISSAAKRRATYQKRIKGLLKKMSELTTLCGVVAFMIIYSQYETQPVIWPNIPDAQSVLSDFERMPNIKQIKKISNQESFIRQSIAKVKKQLKKLMEKNKEIEMKEVMYRCLIGAGVENFDKGELNQLGRVLDDNIEKISKRIEILTIGEGSKDVAAHERG